MPQSQAPGSSLTVTENGTGNSGAVAEPPGSSVDISVSMLPDSGAEGTAVNDEREDLTGFFAIGIVIDVLLVAAFLIWAVRQWRKTGR